MTGRSATGEARFTIDGDSLTITVNATGLPKDIEHWQHFHGFTNGRAAACPTKAADTNGDGIIDMVETGPVAGTAMVPFSGDPVSMDIPQGTYPKASAVGRRFHSWHPRHYSRHQWPRLGLFRRRSPCPSRAGRLPGRSSVCFDCTGFWNRADAAVEASPGSLPPAYRAILRDGEMGERVTLVCPVSSPRCVARWRRRRCARIRSIAVPRGMPARAARRRVCHRCHALSLAVDRFLRKTSITDLTGGR